LTETQNKDLPIVSGGYPPSDAKLPSTLPGDLDFVVRWDGNAHLDLGLINLAKGETLYTATGLNFSRSGGFIPYEDIGGPHGGIDICYWEGGFAKGIYQVVVYDVSGVPVNYKIDVLEHKQPDTILSSTAIGTQGTDTLTGTISKGQVVAGIVEVGGGSLLPPTQNSVKVSTGSLQTSQLSAIPRHR
jgi:hypothetical protein